MVTAQSSTASWGGMHPQDLLPDPFEQFVSSLYAEVPAPHKQAVCNAAKNMDASPATLKPMELPTPLSNGTFANFADRPLADIQVAANPAVRIE